MLLKWERPAFVYQSTVHLGRLAECPSRVWCITVVHLIEPYEVYHATDYGQSDRQLGPVRL